MLWLPGDVLSRRFLGSQWGPWGLWSPPCWTGRRRSSASASRHRGPAITHHCSGQDGHGPHPTCRHDLAALCLDVPTPLPQGRHPGPRGHHLSPGQPSSLLKGLLPSSCSTNPSPLCSQRDPLTHSLLQTLPWLPRALETPPGQRAVAPGWAGPGSRAPSPSARRPGRAPSPPSLRSGPASLTTKPSSGQRASRRLGAASHKGRKCAPAAFRSRVLWSFCAPAPCSQAANRRRGSFVPTAFPLRRSAPRSVEARARASWEAGVLVRGRSTREGTGPRLCCLLPWPSPAHHLPTTHTQPQILFQPAAKKPRNSV